jgi:hypothetical protein
MLTSSCADWFDTNHESRQRVLADLRQYRVLRWSSAFAPRPKAIDREVR